MNIQIYYAKKNFDVQKAERYFKERRIPVQWIDLNKHTPGEKEINLMLHTIGFSEMIDRTDRKVKEHPACYYDREDLLIQAVREDPWLLKTPIVRNGNQMTIGYKPDVWKQWV